MLRASAFRRRLIHSFLLGAATTSRSTTTAAAGKPQAPRKARQSVRRILHLLSTNPIHSQHPSLSHPLSLLQTSPHSLSSSQASTLILSISNPLISFYFYQFLKSLPNFEPNSTLFSSLITSQLQSINPHPPKIQYFIREMKKHNVQLFSQDFRRLFELVVPIQVEIAEFFIRVFLDEVEFDEGPYNYVISVYSDHGFCEKAMLIAERVRKRCENRSLGFYLAMMEVYRKNEEPKAALELFLEMKEREVVASEGIHRILLEILCGVGWIKLCLLVMEEMVKVGFTVDGCLGMRLTEKFVKQNMLSEAEYLLREGVIRGKDSLGVLVEAMAEKGKPLVGFELIRRLNKSGLDVDGCTYACLIRGCGKIGLIRDAGKIFLEVKSSESVLNMGFVYSSMIYVYTRWEMKGMAEMIWFEMGDTNDLQATREAHMYMMSMYGALGLVEEVLKFFDQMKSNGFPPGIDDYVILIGALSKAGKLNLAREFLLEMRNCGIKPTNLIYSLIMESYLRVGMINHGIALIDEYEKSGLLLDEVVVTSIVKILSQAGKFSEVVSYLDKLAKIGLKIPKGKGTALVRMCKDEFCLTKLTQVTE